MQKDRTGQERYLCKRCNLIFWSGEGTKTEDDMLCPLCGEGATPLSKIKVQD